MADRDNITLEMLSDLLDAQTRLREQIEKERLAAHKALQGLVNQASPEWIEHNTSPATPLGTFPADVLAQVIRQKLLALPSTEPQKKSQPDAASAGDGQTETPTSLEVELARLRTENAQLQQELQEARSQPPPEPQQPESGSPAQLPLPNYLTDWLAGQTGQGEATVLQIIGETGLARKQDIIQAVMQRTDFSESTVIRHLERLNNREMILLQAATGGSKTGGHPPQIVTLAPLGQATATLLIGHKPATSEWAERSAHRTDPHALLIIRAIRYLEQSGYQVVRQSERIELPGPQGRVFLPDITAQNNQGIIYVEVERDVRKDAVRKNKWQNFYEASRGNLYVVCETRKLQSAIISEINQAIGTRNFDTHITNLEELDAGERGVKGSIWLRVRLRQQ